MPLYLFDLSSILFRSYYALPPMKNHAGESTHALFGFVRFILKFLKDYSPSHMAVLCDGPNHKQKRTEIFTDYKATREKAPEDLGHQIEWAKDFCTMMGIPFLSVPHAEADDLAASVTHFALEQKWDVVLCTSDKDWWQLLGPHVKGLKEGKWITVKDVEEQFGVKIDQLGDALAIIGDASDHIPGVTGFGPKKTARFLQDYPSLDAFFKDPSNTKYEAIFAAKELLQRNQRLIRLDETVKIPHDPAFYEKASSDESSLQEFYQRMDFKALYHKTPSHSDIKPLPNSSHPFSPQKTTTYSIALNHVEGIIVADHEHQWHLKWKEVKDIEWAHTQAIGQDVKKIIEAFFDHAIPSLPLFIFDLSIAEYLLDPEGINKKRISTIEEIAQRKNDLETALKEAHLLLWLQQVELPLSLVLAKMHHRGIYLDTQVLFEQKKILQEQLHSLQNRIFAATGEAINLNSPKQLGTLLFETLKLAGGKKTRTGQYSTDNDTLIELQGSHPVVELIIEYRTLEKLRSTYVDALLALVNEDAPRIHCSFEQCVTATGRLSCQNPNLQNIPPSIRKAFRPEKTGWHFLAADYSQIELRLLAHYSRDEQMCEAFSKGLDIHRYTASLIFDVPLEKVQAEQRAIAKTVNFGILYGQTPFGLSKVIRISPAKAKEFIDAYFKRYPQVTNYLEKVKEEARKSGKIYTEAGRWRFVPGITSQNSLLRQAAERIALNTPLQGFAADLIKIAMLRIDEQLPHFPHCTLLLQIHDELLFEGPEKEIQKLAPVVKRIMEEVWPPLSVPLDVHIAIGENWQEC